MKKTPNEEQRQVVEELTENILLFASAGTGKTFTVANRVANILAKGLASAEEILCLTFTIKACNEMREDIAFYTQGAGKETQVNTIHGFCYRALMEESKRTGGGYGEVGVCDEVDQEELLKSILSSRYYAWRAEDELRALGLTLPSIEQHTACRRLGQEELYLQVGDYLLNEYGELLKKEEEVEETTEPFFFARKSFEIYHRKAAIRNFVSEMKHCQAEGAFYSDSYQDDVQRVHAYLEREKPRVYEGLISLYTRGGGYSPDEEFAKAMREFAPRLMAEYDERLRQSNLLDFDDLILNMRAVLNTEEGEAFWSNRYKYIVLDEMQDTSLLEYSVLKKIFAKNNVLLCGDFFQTIYGWRGSRPLEIFQAFEEEFSPKRYMLSANYRATKTLAEATFGFLRNLYPQFMGKYCPKTLDIHSETEGERIFCYAFDSYEEEARQIYKYLRRLDSDSLQNVCVIARSNKYIARLTQYMENFAAQEKEGKGLQFFTVEEHFQFFKKPVVKDVLACIKLLSNPFDGVSMERIAQRYVKGVGIKRIESLRKAAELGASICSFLDEKVYRYGDPYEPLLDGFQKDRVVVYDTETTGLDVSTDEIIQLSAVKMGKNGVIEELDIFIEPTVEISQEAFETHGFDLEYVRTHGGVSAKEGLAKFSAFVEGCALVGHNNFAFDKPLVARSLEENGLPKLSVLAEYDTLRLAKLFYPQLKNYKLSTLCELFSVQNEQAHNALGDIRATAACLERLLVEKVLPTAMERRTLFDKEAGKFEKFFAFMQELTERFEQGEALGGYIAERLLLEKRYPAKNDRKAVAELIESLRFEGENKREALREYLKDAALSSSQLDELVKRGNKIPVITAHQAKGCEFDTVVLAGADDGNFPSYAAKQSGSEEEEKKIFYVAISRAKKRLILTRAVRNNGYEIGETPYVWYIPEEYIRENRAWKNGK